MVFSYWEQACALLNYGLLHEDLFFETSGEFFGVWELVKGVLPEARERFADPQFLAHLEKAAHRFEAWMESRAPGHIAAMRQFMRQMSAQLAAGAKALIGHRQRGNRPVGISALQSKVWTLTHQLEARSR